MNGQWLRDRLVADILETIRSGGLAEGDRLPSERDIAERRHVSRTTVRDAFQTLAGLGAIRIVRGRGAFVEDTDAQLGVRLISMTQPAEVHSLFEIRKAIEPAVSSWAASRSSRGEAEALSQLVRSVIPLGLDTPENTPLDAPHIAHADQAFHLQLVRCSKNPVALHLMENLLDLLADSRKQSLKIPGRALKSWQDHWRIAEAIARRDPDRAREAMVTHLADVEEAIVRHLVRYP